MAITSSITVTVYNLSDSRWGDSAYPTPTEIETSITEIKADIDGTTYPTNIGVSNSSVSWVQGNNLTGVYAITLKLYNCTLAGVVPTCDDMETMVETIGNAIEHEGANVEYGGMRGVREVADDRSMTGSPPA